MKANKYRAKKITTASGEVFDSKGEYNRWLVLLHAQKYGQIKNLRRQVVYELIPKQAHPDGRKEHRTCYKCDFEYEEGGLVVVEDYKSPVTRKLPEYIIKRKLMLQVLGISIKETGSKK